MRTPAEPWMLLLGIWAGCAAPLPRKAPTAASCLPAVDVTEYPGAPMAGFDELADEGKEAWRKGDRALLALSLEDGNRVERWLLDLEVVDDRVDGTRMSTWGGMTFQSELMLVRVTVAGAAGETLGQTMVRAPRDWLAFGLAPCCEATNRIRTFSEEARGTVAMSELRIWMHGLVTLTALLELVQNDPTLARILWGVVRTPSLFALIGGLGSVTVNVRLDFNELVDSQRPPHMPEIGDFWCLPVDLEVNGEAALYCNLLVSTPRPPYALCGGIVGMQATHPSDPDLRFFYLLLAARRGPHDPAGQP